MPDQPNNAASGLPMLYFNGFEMGFGSSDIQVKLHLDNVEILGLKASYTTAKTLCVMLQKTIDSFETITNHKVMTILEVGDAIKTNKLSENAHL